MSPLYDGNWTTYTWIVVVAVLVCFGFAWAIGANDVANAFGTSVGAKTLSLLQACIIAGIFEFVGAITLGMSVASAVAASIAHPEVFFQFPELYMYGMMCALAAAGIWVTVATYFEMAVSTTHSSIGAIMGFALVWQGSEAIVWSQATDSFPFRAGFVPIVISWFSSPIISGILASGNFLLNRSLILRRDNAVRLAFVALPLLVMFTVFINVFFILQKGAGKQLQWSPGHCAWVAAVVGGGSGIFTAVAIVPLLMLRHKSVMLTHALPQHGMSKVAGQVASVMQSNKGMRRHLKDELAELGSDARHAAHSGARGLLDGLASILHWGPRGDSAAIAAGAA
uniref:Phosphate transporter n=1 Tax=Chlamydomonas euryale TaxID=1486919 RepID=A0A7R9VRD9_9CHLO|mmetsp:Transcript_4316/g.12445  ORF Transcript_4316/g.12445 Transcript_4316/m.12445 type:complete len:339 (+) Transcript_4316:525-1541(+)